MWRNAASAVASASTSSSSSTKPLAIRVITYNVLSSQLASPSHYTTYDPAHLDANNRLPLVLQHLESEISSAPSNKVVVCLQEISYEWAGALHTWFANQGYHMVTGLYGRKFNGYMGVAIAYPTAAFETVHVDISRLSDTRTWPKPPKEDEPGVLSRVLGSVLQTSSSVLLFPYRFIGGFFFTPPKYEPEDHWSMSQRRFNVLITTTLKDRDTGALFCVGTYHMPCAYYAPMAMTLHTELAAHHVQSLAERAGGGDGTTAPCVLAGDFNIKPDSSQYRMVTTGELPSEDPGFPAPKFGTEFQVRCRKMQSAYAARLGGEPDFTNYSRVKENDLFVDTLDYIFCSQEWSVERVKPLVHRGDANGPLPNADEPSDHLLISADLKLGGVWGGAVEEAGSGEA